MKLWWDPQKANANIQQRGVTFDALRGLQVYFASISRETDDTLPADIDDASLFQSVPHTNHLDLGRDLALRFAAKHLPALKRQVEDRFRQRGAYGRFKALLERSGQLERWYQYEQEATRSALLAWAAEAGPSVTDGKPPLR
nr:hypothetical protein [Variovorax boronicumulans]